MKRFLLAAACLLCAVVVSAPASAALLGLDHLIGTVKPASPASAGDEIVYVNNLIKWYNGDIGDPSGDPPPSPPSTVYTYMLNPGASVPAPDLALATGGVQSVGVPGWPLDTTGYTYLWAKFGNDGALYWLGSITSIEGFDPATGPYPARAHGLSHVTLFGPGTTQVPEGGALMMLGFGLAGIRMLRRFL